MTATPSTVEAVPARRDSSKRQILAELVGLLFGNSNTAVGVTLVAAPILGRVQWGAAPHPVVLGWCLYMFLVTVARFVLARRYWSSVPSIVEPAKWGTAFAVGAGLAGAGWGAAGILLYPEADLAHQVLLVFIVGGMMLGSASLLAPWPEAFVAFVVPAGAACAVRLAFHGDQAHLAMGLLAGLFTVALLVTSGRMHRTILSTLKLQFENQDLVDDLREAKRHAESLNERLEARVRERTAELQQSAEQLRVEITQRERMEEELLRARKLESLGVLAGGIAHDFNNFLAVIQGNIEMVKMQLNPDDTVREVLDQTASACHRAALLSSQLLTFAKGGAPIRRLTSVSALVMDAVSLTRAGARTSIQVGVAADLLAADVDAGQISQVLHNILLNARQAMPEGGIVEVKAENVAPEGTPGAVPRVRISIRDNGCGIPAAILPRIFDPYFTTKKSGRGLGLATAYAIVAKHGGSLSVESNPGNGAIFTIELPASQETVAMPAPVGSPMQTGTERLLIMDDEDALRTLLERILTRLGYEVRTARDGTEAIAMCMDAKAAGRRFEAALLDLTVSGGMGGIEAAAKLREVDPALKLIVSSGYSDAPVMSDFRKYGFDDVVPKPWAVGEISKVFRRVLGPDTA
jgi:signal transduction histidine kinase/CheY-like chemotaxis protein